jgi:radical SAM superfamily enzyme YgiQ (UPF0313 family)
VLLVHLKAFPISAVAPACLIAWARRDPGLRDVSFDGVEFDQADSADKIARAILARGPRLVGFSCYVWNYRATRAAALRLKELSPALPVIFGGPEVSGAARKELERTPEIDFICSGEGEETLRRLARSLFLGDGETSRVPGLVSRVDGEVRQTADAPLIDLEKTDSPYLTGLLDGDADVVVLETSRGCPFDCSFCDWGPKVVRYIPVDRLEAEFALLAGRTKSIMTTDADLTMNKKRGVKILEAFLRATAGTDCVLTFELNPVFLAQEIVDVIARAPKKFGLACGIQSVRAEVLKNIDRTFDLERIEKNLTHLHDKVPDAVFMFSTIFGLPGDDLQGMRETVDWCLRWRPSLLRVNHPQVLPGTEMEKSAEALGMTYQSEPPHQALRSGGMNAAELGAAREFAIHVALLMNLPAIYFELLGAARPEEAFGYVGAIEDWIAALNAGAVRLPGAETWREIDGRLVSEIGDEAYTSIRGDVLLQAALMHCARGVAQKRQRRAAAAAASRPVRPSTNREKSILTSSTSRSRRSTRSRRTS